MFNRLTASQKRGAIILLAVVVALVGWRWRVSYLAQQADPAELATEQEAAGGERLGNEVRTKGEKAGKKQREIVRVELNGADTTELMRVKGIGPTFARRIVKYRRLIGGFQRVEDLQQVYGIDSERYAGIAPQVYVEPVAAPVDGPVASPVLADGEVLPLDSAADDPPRELAERPAEKGPALPVNLNTADSAALDAVSGIGPKTARTLLKYRQRIFFFHSLDQLSEVWGIRPENLERMRGELTVGDDFSAFPHLAINRASADELAAHGYISPKQAGIIVAYRDQHGPFASMADLSPIKPMDAAFWERLQPYIQF